MNKTKLKAIEKAAIKAINRYYLVPEYYFVGDCNICRTVNCDCNDCPFFSMDKKIDCDDLSRHNDFIGLSTRGGVDGSDKAAWQKELKTRYNQWAKRNNMPKLVWENKK